MSSNFRVSVIVFNATFNNMAAKILTVSKWHWVVQNISFFSANLYRLGILWKKKPILMQIYFFSKIIIFTVYWRALKAFCNYISHIWKVYLFIQYLMLKTVKRDKCAKYSWSSKLLFPVYFCVQQFNVSSKILCPLSLLI